MTGLSSVGIEELERRLRGGDTQALAELFARDRERLWRIVEFRLAQPLRGREFGESVSVAVLLVATVSVGHVSSLQLRPIRCRTYFAQ